MTDPTEMPVSTPPLGVTAAPPVPAPTPAPADTVEDGDSEPPFSLRSSCVRLRADVRRTIATLTVSQLALGIGGTALCLGLTLLPPPVELGHLMLAIGAIILTLTATRAPAVSGVRALAEPDIGHVVGLVEGLERKIEHLKDTQWELSESEIRYRELLDAQDDVIVRRDAQGRLTFVNRAFTRVFGLDGDQILGKPFRPIVHEGETPDTAVFSRGLRRAYAQRIETAAGARWFAWEEQVIPAAQGGPAAQPNGQAPAGAMDQERQYQCIGRDVTAEREHQAELAKARDAAQAASRAKSRFLAVMSHEIRTPMNGIMGMTSLLEETELTPEQETYTKAVGQSAKTLLTLIDEILDFSKIEAGKLDLRQAPFALDETVQGVIELLARRAHEKGLAIAWSMSAALPRVVVGDEARVRQILMNMVGNAIKFTEAGGVLVTVGAVETAADIAAPEPDRVAMQITVRDTGIGLAPAALATLFHEFEQVDSSSTRRHAGTGLGLAISRHLAEAMGGSIRVESQLGAGATFTLRLMLGRSRRTGTIGETLSALSPPRRVLLMLEAGLEAEAMAATLNAHGSEAEQATLADADCRIVMAAAAGQPFDVLMVDASCDSREAGAVLAHMRSSLAGPAAPTQVRGIVTVKAGERDRLLAFRAEGFAGYLVRPVRPTSLLTQIGAGLTPAAVSQVATPTAPSDDRPRAAPQAAPRPSARAVWRPNVLLAEDNEIGAVLARTMLDKSGCDVVRVRTGHEAIAAFIRSLTGPHDRPFDLILMDMHMPEMDGLEATRDLLARHDSSGGDQRSGMPMAPIVALTANAFADDRAQCLEAGMVDYLAKPFLKAELMAILEKWCHPAPIGRGHGAIEDAFQDDAA